MRVEKVDFNKTGSFSKTFLDYVVQEPKLSSTSAFEPTLDGFGKALSSRKFSQDHRNNLVKVLEEQYQQIKSSDSVTENIDLLRSEKTFTVTTGHQLNIFTGPLFFIYKIASTINICRQLSARFPDNKFVPIYWMASEDHDFEEINHVFVDGEKYTWQTTQTGAVGHFSTKELAELADTIPGRIDLFKEAYLKADKLADSVRTYVNELFGDYGLLVLDPDDQLLKEEFTSVMKDDLLEHSAFTKVNEGSNFLIEQGYKPQLNPREINLFYLDENLRTRIEKKGGKYAVVDTDLLFTEDEILSLLTSNPEKFSPNVILRPLYQEVILPNLGYVGGPAELAYWLQYKKMFDHFKVDFPVLMPRNFNLYLSQNAQRKKQHLGLDNEDLFTPLEELKKRYVHRLNSKLSLENKKEEVLTVYNSIKQLAHGIDSTLEPHIDAELVNLHKRIDRIENKLVKAEKRQHEDEMIMIDALKEYAFPGGIPQERRVNFLSINDNNFIDNLLVNTDPFDLRMHILLE